MRRTRSLVVTSFGGPEALELAEVELPEPGPGQVRIEVAASAVNPIDLSTRAGRMTEGGLVPALPMTSLGWDVAGTVDAVGPGVTRFGPGRAVVGLRDLLSQVPGAQSDHVVVEEGALAAAPRRVGLEVAATLPLAGLTADGALRLAGLRAGSTLLLTGAAGSVGRIVLQLARRAGVRTIAVARGSDEDLVTSLGAAALVTGDDDVSRAARALAPGGVDAVIDGAVMGIGVHEALRPGGVFVALVRPFAPPPLRGTTVVVQETFADGARLEELAALVDAGVLVLPDVQTVPLADARLAHERVERGGLRERLVLVPAREEVSRGVT